MVVVEAQVRGASIRSRAVEAVLTATITIFLTGGGAAQSVPAPELKAAYLFHFAQFVEWPADEVPDGSPLVLCVDNDGAVAEALEQAIKGRTAGRHALLVKRLEAGAPLPICHVLYFGASDKKRWLDVREMLHGRLVLTVSDAARFAQTGGMVELRHEDGRIRIAVNVDALQRANVQLSSRVLALATIVKDAPPQ